MLLTQNGRSVKIYVAGTIQKEQAQDIQFPVSPHQMRHVICEMGPIIRKGRFVSVLGLVKRSPSQRARPFQHCP